MLLLLWVPPPFCRLLLWHAFEQDTPRAIFVHFRHAMELLGDLEDREATVLKLRFGLGGEEPKTLKEIGAELGLTRERVRQIETEALRRLADGLTDPRDRNY